MGDRGDPPGPFPRGQPAQVGHPLLGADHRHVVLGVVDVGDHRDDAGHPAVAGHRRGDEDGQMGVAGVVPGAADAVDHRGPGQVGRVDLPVEVDPDGRIDGDHAQAPDGLAAVGHLLGAEDQVAAESRQVAVEPLLPGRRQGQGGPRGPADHPGLDQVEHRVLDDLGKEGQTGAAPVGQGAEDGVTDAADAHLQREEAGRQATGFHLALEEGRQMPADPHGHLIRWLEGVGMVRSVGQDHRRQALGVKADHRASDALERVGQGQGLPAGRPLVAPDVVHPEHLRGVPPVQFDNDPPGHLRVKGTVAHR
jgi:hypothetical protein